MIQGVLIMFSVSILSYIVFLIINPFVDKLSLPMSLWRTSHKRMQRKSKTYYWVSEILSTTIIVSVIALYVTTMIKVSKHGS